MERGDPLCATHQIHDNWVADSRTWSRRSLHRLQRKSSDMRKPIRRVNSRKPLHFTVYIREMICPGDPYQRSPNAPQFEDRSQEETEWEEQGVREAAWKLAKSFLKIVGLHRDVNDARRACANRSLKTNKPSSHLRKIGACLHQLLNLRNKNLLWTPERRCT